MRIPELLAPAGDPEKLRVAFTYGADAVYGGVSHFSLRHRSGKEFDMESFAQGIDYAHRLGKKVYATVNGFPFNNQLELVKEHLAQMAQLGPDAFIVSTPGVIRLAKEVAPHIPLHLSTQANVLNWMDAAVWADMGVTRIIAAREVSLSDLEGIKTHLPQMELEIFIHGSMCFAYSGRCLISSLQTGRVANRGSCANDCRYPYELYVKNADTDVLMRLEEYPDEGTYIFNAADLNLASHLKEITDSGIVDSLKIEGRTKSPYYVGLTTRTYRQALNDLARGNFYPDIYQQELATTKHRGFTDGYLVRRPFEKAGTQTLESSISEGTMQVHAIVTEDGAHFMCKERIDVDTPYEILPPLETLLTPVQNEIGTIYESKGRYYLRLLKIETATGKRLGEVHSGNENPIALPVNLPPFTFLRRQISLKEY